MGRQAKEFTLTKPKSAASKGRTYALYCAVGVDVREVELTNKEAHDMLNDANSGKAYHVRKQLLDMGGRAAKRDVAKEHRKDPKPRKTAKSKGNGDPDVKELLKLLKQRPELLASLLADGETEDEEEEEEALPETKAKSRAKTGSKNTKKPTPKNKTKGTRVTTKSGETVTINPDDTISDEDLLTMLGDSIAKAS